MVSGAMHRFRLLAQEVRASRVGADGHVVIDGRELVGDAGSWVVTSSDGVTVWSDAEFRRRFEPADDEARAYLALTP